MDAMECSMDDAEAMVVSTPSEAEDKPNKRKTSPPQRSKKAPQVTKTLVGDKPKKKHRFRPGTVALREIRAMQGSTNLLIPRQTMRRLVRQLANEQASGTRLTHDAYESLHVAAESFLTQLFESGMNMAIFAGRKSLELRDLRMAIEQSGISLSSEFMERARRIRSIK